MSSGQSGVLILNTGLPKKMAILSILMHAKKQARTVAAVQITVSMIANRSSRPSREANATNTCMSSVPLPLCLCLRSLSGEQGNYLSTRNFLKAFLVDAERAEDLVPRLVIMQQNSVEEMYRVSRAAGELREVLGVRENLFCCG